MRNNDDDTIIRGQYIFSIDLLVIWRWFRAKVAQLRGNKPDTGGDAEHPQ